MHRVEFALGSIACLISFCLVTPLAAETAAPPVQLEIAQAASLIEFDGVVSGDEAAWAGASVLEVELIPGDTRRAALSLSSFAGNLLIGFECPLPYQRAQSIMLVLVRLEDGAQQAIRLRHDPWTAELPRLTEERLAEEVGGAAVGVAHYWKSVERVEGVVTASAYHPERGHAGGWSSEILIASPVLDGAQRLAFGVEVASEFGRMRMPARSNDRRPETLIELTLPQPHSSVCAAPELLERAKVFQARNLELLEETQRVKILRDLPGAARAYAHLVELDPLSVTARFFQASFARLAGDMRSYLETLTVLRRDCPTFIGLPGQEAFAHALVEANQWERARAEFAAVPASNVRRQIDEGMIAYHLGEFADAARLIEKTMARPDLLQGKRDELAPFLQFSRAYAGGWQAEEQAFRDRDEQSAVAGNPLPVAEIHMLGEVVRIELFEDDAPNTVANFIVLADAGFFDGIRFHMVIGNALIQGGDPNTKDDNPRNDGEGGPGYDIPFEESPRRHFRGTVGMMDSGPGRNRGSVFYVTVSTAAHMNPGHTVFGRVTSGQEVIERAQVDDVIEKIEVVSRRAHPYVVEKIE